jgi:hypothetical protein
VELSDGFSGYGSNNPYYKTTVPVMIDDLNKIRSIIESTECNSWSVLGKNTSLFERRHVCIMCFGYGLFDLYARKRKRNYMNCGSIRPIKPLTDYTIGINFYRENFLKWGIAMADLQNKIRNPRRHRHVKRLRKHTDAIFRMTRELWLGRNHQECYFIKKTRRRILGATHESG